jgi:hypothetical protein
MNKQKTSMLIVFDISNLEKKTIHIDYLSKPKLENKREHVKSKGIENTLKIFK